MKKYSNGLLYTILTIIFLLLLSPIISLLLPEKLTNHTYYRLIYHVIVDKETKKYQSDETKALNLLRYVVNHQFLGGIPFKCKAAESLIFGEAYCDFQARVLNVLLGVAGIQSRYAMLLDKDDISPHTLNEVFLGNKWCVFDTSLNIAYEDSRANYVSLEEMSRNPDLIYNNEKIVELKKFNKGFYEGFVQWYSRMFPIPSNPRRSTPVLLQVHIFDHLIDIYFAIFKYKFFNPYQNIYLNFKKKYAGEDFRLFFMARNYHLAYRYDLALKYYNLLLENYPQSKYVQDAIFFTGILYFETKNFDKAIEFFKLILEKFPQKWQSATFYYLGRTYEETGDKQASLLAYRRALWYNLSTQTLEELNRQGLQHD